MIHTNRRKILAALLAALPATTLRAQGGASGTAFAPPYRYADEVIVFKAQRRLRLMLQGEVLREMPMRLGFEPIGHKQRSGDGRTPEGRYTLIARNPNSDYFLSLMISYPNVQDRQRAAAQGWDPGGDIVIHGLPNVRRYAEHLYLARDWTEGCIALSNADMLDVWMMVCDGTPITIHA